MSDVQWRNVNGDGFEYAIQQGPHGDEFVKLLDGSCLRKAVEEAADDETLAAELRRLVTEYEIGDHNKEEAWNLIADFSVCNVDTICAALHAHETG